jgi:tRNA dimethylallyltransferase
VSEIKQLIVIQGPTAGGKTDLAIALANYFSTVILSADSRQFYRELSIGTAKPSPSEQQGIRHYFVDSHSITEDVPAALYEKEVRAILNREFQVHNTVIIVGGSGLFVDAVCYGLDDIPTSRELREIIMTEIELSGLDKLRVELKEKDPEYYDEVDLENPVRIIRAIEVIRLTGQKYSALRNASKRINPFEIKRFIIEHPREQLYARINERVDQMMASGLLNEVKSVMQFRNQNALQTVGYKELFEFLDGNCTLNDAVEKIKQHTRNYAKRQITWFRKYDDAVRIPFTSTEQMLHQITLFLE